MNKNLGALVSWREGVDRLASLKSNFLTVRQTPQYRLFTKIIKRARNLRAFLIRGVFACYVYWDANGKRCIDNMHKAHYAPVKRKIDGLSAVIKKYRRKRLDLLKGKDPYVMPEIVVYNFMIFKSNNSIDGFFLYRYGMYYLWEVHKEYPPARFDYFPHPKGFYVREKPILTPPKEVYIIRDGIVEF